LTKLISACGALVETRLPPEQLELELTETVLVGRSARA
jgi:EAL domain-containing protein (putative c-di-GMP-specific phosphodiesterase class I)